MNKSKCFSHKIKVLDHLHFVKLLMPLLTQQRRIFALRIRIILCQVSLLSCHFSEDWNDYCPCRINLLLMINDIKSPQRREYHPESWITAGWVPEAGVSPWMWQTISCGPPHTNNQGQAEGMCGFVLFLFLVVHLTWCFLSRVIFTWKLLVTLW